MSVITVIAWAVGTVAFILSGAAGLIYAASHTPDRVWRWLLNLDRKDES